MTTTTNAASEEKSDTVIDFEDGSSSLNVLVTGFGPFNQYATNPSWEAVKQLHGTTLSSSKQDRPISVQCINLPVSYGATLDTVPRLHGHKPSSPFAQPAIDPRGPKDGSQGDGRSYPEGYDGLALPARGWDAIIHVGVGAAGAFKLEKLGHKRGYAAKDAFGSRPPPMKRFFALFLVAAAIRAFKRVGQLLLPTSRLTTLSKKLRPRFIDGGFGSGYSSCPEEARTALDVDALVSHLDARGHAPVSASTDAGHFLCDFTYYCSLVESRRRRSSPSTPPPVPVLFVHVPPDGQPHDNTACVSMLKDLIPAIMAQKANTPAL